MKTFQFTLVTITLFLSLSIQAQNDRFASRGYISPNYTIHYLAMNLVQSSNLEGKDEVELSPKYVTLFSKAFSAIRNSKHSSHGSVMPYYSMNQVVVILKDKQFWQNKAIQQLLKQHQLQYKLKKGTYREHTYLIYRKKDFNTKALITSLKKYPAVSNAYSASTGLAGSGSRIRYKLKDNILKISFGRGFGDCPAGCIHWVYNNYEVDTRTYKVKFLGGTGNVLKQNIPIKAKN